jgi:hypothetical protein
MSIRVTDTIPTPTEFPSTRTLSSGYSAISSGVLNPQCYRAYPRKAANRRFVVFWERLLTVSHIPQGICLLTSRRIGLLQEDRTSLFKAHQEIAPVRSFEVEEVWRILKG